MPLTVHTMQAKKVAYARQRAATQPRNYRVYGPSPPPVSYWPPTRSMIGGLDATSPTWYEGPLHAEMVLEAEPLMASQDQATPAQILRGLGCISGMRVPAQAETSPTAATPASNEVGLAAGGSDWEQGGWQRQAPRPRSGLVVCGAAGDTVHQAAEGVAGDHAEPRRPLPEEEDDSSTPSASSRQRPGSACSASRVRPTTPVEASGAQPAGAGRGPRSAPLSIRGLQGVAVSSTQAERNRVNGQSLLRRALSLPTAGRAPTAGAATAAAKPRPTQPRSATCPTTPTVPASSSQIASATPVAPQPAPKRRSKAGNISKRFVLPFAYTVDDPRLAHLDSTDGRTLPEFLTSDGHY